MKKISILGSTGSIGRKTLDIVRMFPQDFTVDMISAYNNLTVITAQIKEFSPKYVCVSEQIYPQVRDIIRDKGIQLFCGDSGIIDGIDASSSDIYVSAIMGKAAIRPTYATIAKQNVRICLANKEVVVSSGKMLKDVIKKNNCELIPLDSEHNSLFQSLNGLNVSDNVSSIIITASGGALWNWDFSTKQKIIFEQHLKHPIWPMGDKITVDSSTMVNKALELVEACYLFDVDEKKVEIIVNTEALFHSFVRYKDGTLLANISSPDMIFPISHALFYPKRAVLSNNDFDILTLSASNFFSLKPYFDRIISIVRQCINSGVCYTSAFNVANELAVADFLSRKLDFFDITRVIENTLDNLEIVDILNVEDVINYGKYLQDKAQQSIKKLRVI